MEFVRDVIDSSLLDKINLPKSLKNKKVEIIILPLYDSEDKKVKESSLDNVIGILSKYKNPGLISLEKKAWAEAMVDKYAVN